MGILFNMRPRVVVHLNEKRWVFTMDSPKQYTKVLDRLEQIAGVDTEVLPTSLSPGQEVEIAVKLPDEIEEFISNAQIQSEATALFPCLDKIVKYDCGCFENPMRRVNSLADLIIHLNDHHKWTRNEIADWIESLDIDMEMAA